MPDAPMRDRDWYLSRGLFTDERIGYFLATCAGFWPDRELVMFEGERYRYADLYRWSIAVARLLAEAGIGPGDRVLIQATNSVELLAVQFGAWRIGAVTVPIVPMYRAHELRSIITDVQPKVVITSGQVGSRSFAADMEQLLGDLRHVPLLKLVLCAEPSLPQWRAIPRPPRDGAAVDDSDLPEPLAASAGAVLLFTSGSTAAPKGAMLRSGAIVNNARTFQRLVGIGQEDVALCATPLGHTGALINGLIVPMCAGGRSVVLPAWRPDDAVAAIEAEGVTYMSAPPLILQDLVERYEAAAPAGHRLRKFYGGGGVVPPSLVERADAVGIKAIRAYGMTETTGNITICHTAAPIDRRARFDGRPYYGSELQIVDADRRPLAAGSIGEVRVRSPLLMIGYTDSAATAAQMDADGWFYTGDLGRLDPDGWFTFEGRLKDIINRGGEKFSSQDIESAIAGFPDIADVAVVAAPHPRFGEVVAAFIRLRAGATWSGPDRIVDHLNTVELARQKHPVEWHVLDEFPRTPSGKVQKQALRARLWDEPVTP